MKTVYEVLSERDKETGLMYKAWDVPEGLPLQHNFITEPIPDYLNVAKYDYRQEKWIEDTELIEKSKVEQLEIEISIAQDRVSDLEDVVLELLMTEMRNK